MCGTGDWMAASKNLPDDTFNPTTDSNNFKRFSVSYYFCILILSHFRWPRVSCFRLFRSVDLVGGTSERCCSLSVTRSRGCFCEYASATVVPRRRTYGEHVRTVWIRNCDWKQTLVYVREDFKVREEFELRKSTLNKGTSDEFGLGICQSRTLMIHNICMLVDSWHLISIEAPRSERIFLGYIPILRVYCL